MDINFCTEDQEQLILNNLKLVHFFAKRYTVPLHEYDDIVSIGRIGLVKAAITFDKSKSVKFSSYASRCIDNEIKMYLRKKPKNISISSLDEPATTDSNGNSITIGEVTSDPNSNFESSIIAHDLFIELINIIINVFQGKERCVLLFTLAGYKQKEMADFVQLSRSYVSKLQRKLIAQVKDLFNKTSPVAYDKIFKMNILDNSYQLSFSTKDVNQSDQVLANFSEIIAANPVFSETKVLEHDDHVKISFLSDPIFFDLIAQLMLQIDKANSNTVTDNEK